MKANELMQGDLILYEYNGEKFHARVVEIYRSSALVESVSKEYEPIEIEEDKLSPVPLTPEILEKNGFVYNAIPFADGWEQFGLTLYRGGNGYRINCGINVSLIIDCVHQLQLALRLCGIDKEIEL